MAARQNGLACSVFDELRQRTVLRKPPPWGAPGASDVDWQDHDDLLAATWLQENGIAVSPEVASQAIEVVARRSKFHPVREYLGRLKWDGNPRIDKWLSYYLGVDDSEYSRAVGKCWLISAVARAYQPGCKVDTAIVLEGEQGRLKSTAIKVLSKPWTTDELADIGSKDAAMQLVGVWIVEMAELEGITAVKVSTIKAFITRSVDRYRPPYGRRVMDFPRQCVFAGSVNENQYLRDATGGRRFLPVECKSIDIESLTRDRDQLWAEARLRFEDGERWWFNDPALERRAALQQRGRHREDPWEPIVAQYLALLSEQKRKQKTEPPEPPQVTVNEILRNALKVGADQFGNIDVGKWKQSDSNRVADCLKKLQWKRQQVRIDRKQVWVYRPAAEPEDDASPVTSLED